MRIISWNCNGKFREKYTYIEKYHADIYVIQECEDPEQSGSPSYMRFAQNGFWIGDNKNRGLGIFGNPCISLKRNDWETDGLRYFLSVKVNEEKHRQFDLLGVWACKPYVRGHVAYQDMHIDKYNERMVIMGDFNSNAIWDRMHGEKCHSQIVDALDRIHLVSAYHYTYNESQGKESQFTFYHYKKLDKGYHIDHCFVNKNILNSYQILSDNKFLPISDHIPICVDIGK